MAFDGGKGGVFGENPHFTSREEDSMLPCVDIQVVGCIQAPVVAENPMGNEPRNVRIPVGTLFGLCRHFLFLHLPVHAPHHTHSCNPVSTTSEVKPEVDLYAISLSPVRAHLPLHLPRHATQAHEVRQTPEGITSCSTGIVVDHGRLIFSPPDTVTDGVCPEPPCLVGAFAMMH